MLLWLLMLASVVVVVVSLQMWLLMLVARFWGWPVALAEAPAPPSAGSLHSSRCEVVVGLCWWWRLCLYGLSGLAGSSPASYSRWPCWFHGAA